MCDRLMLSVLTGNFFQDNSLEPKPTIVSMLKPRHDFPLLPDKEHSLPWLRALLSFQSGLVSPSHTAFLSDPGPLPLSPPLCFPPSLPLSLLYCLCTGCVLTFPPPEGYTRSEHLFFQILSYFFREAFLPTEKPCSLPSRLEL